MQALSFSFENIAVRTLGNPETPLFVALDVCHALGFQKARNAVAQHVDAEDLVKTEIDTKGGKQTVNCVNESGLYALIFGSKLESAKRFKRWVTTEVLPAIRKSGKYECPANPKYITPQQGWLIQAAVQKRVHKDGVTFQTVYQALKAHFQIPKYTFLREEDFDAALEFIATCELKAPVKKEPKPVPMHPQESRRHDGQCPCCGCVPIPDGSIVLSYEEAESLLTFIYCVHFLFRDANEYIYQMLRAVDSPMAGKVWDAMHGVNWGRMLDILAKHGHDIRDMECYQHFIARRA